MIWPAAALPCRRHEDNGSTPVILYGPDCRCTRARAATSHCGRYLPADEHGLPRYAPDDGVDSNGVHRAGLGDAARIEVAWPASAPPLVGTSGNTTAAAAAAAATSGIDPYLVKWTKAAPGPVVFTGLPCSFPGRVWRSKNPAPDGSGRPYWNQVCALNGTA